MSRGAYPLSNLLKNFQFLNMTFLIFDQDDSRTVQSTPQEPKQNA
jgi:hypothetical protein